MTQTEKGRSLSYIKLGLVLLVTIAFFAYGSYKLVAEKMYYHVTVEQYHQDNESITEAFRKQSALNRHLTTDLAEQRVKTEMQQELLEKKTEELAAKQNDIQKAEKGYSLLQKKFEKVQYEKDSLIAVLASLRRAE